MLSDKPPHNSPISPLANPHPFRYDRIMEVENNTGNTGAIPQPHGGALAPPFQPGQSGNPAGRPKGSRNRSTVMRQWIEMDADDGQGGTREDQIVRKKIAQATAGDHTAYELVMDALYGKQSTPIDMRTGELPPPAPEDAAKAFEELSKEA